MIKMKPGSDKNFFPGKKFALMLTNMTVREQVHTLLFKSMKLDCFV